jgi:5'-nucleotidase
VTRRAVFEILPFENSISVVTLTGAELIDLFRRAVEGTAHSGLEVSGAVIELRSDPEGNRTVQAVKVDGKPVDPGASYRVAMNSFMASGGDAYLSRDTGSKRQDDPMLMYEMLEQHFAKHREVTPSLDDRYIVR